VTEEGTIDGELDGITLQDGAIGWAEGCADG